MSATAAVVWGAAILVVLVLVLAAVQAARAARLVLQIKQRVDRYAELPIVASLEKAGQDAERLGVAVAAIDRLVARARDAVALIRKGPIPDDIKGSVMRIGIEIQNLREFSP